MEKIKLFRSFQENGRVMAATEAETYQPLDNIKFVNDFLSFLNKNEDVVKLIFKIPKGLLWVKRFVPFLAKPINKIILLLDALKVMVDALLEKKEEANNEGIFNQ